MGTSYNNDTFHFFPHLSCLTIYIFNIFVFSIGVFSFFHCKFMFREIGEEGIKIHVFFLRNKKNVSK